MKESQSTVSPVCLLYGCREQSSLSVCHLAHLNIFEAEGDFAVFAVKGSGFAFSLIMAIFFTEKDEDLTRFALYAFKFTSAFVLRLGKCNRIKKSININIY